MRTLITSIVLTAALAAGSAQAEDGVLRVRLTGLDLSRASDLAIAQHRVDVAIRDYCQLPTAYPMGGFSNRCKYDLQRRTEIQLAAMQASASNSRVASR